jgi:predicted TPR repeat methyltransferase
MDACGCDEFATVFDRRTAEHDLERYRTKGPDRTTQMLLDMVRPAMGTGATLLDIGGGIGVLDHELLRAGAGHATIVDASPAYLAAARQEANRRHVLDRIEFVDGDFVRHAHRIEAADIVTLDRVVCCYGDAAALVGLSADRARRVYGLVLPRDGWLIRLGIRLVNIGFAIRRKAYRAYAHPNAVIDRMVADQGLLPREERSTWFWRVVVYERR